VLVLDEPTFGQDSVTWARLVALIDETRAQGTGLVLATHDHAVIDALAATEFELGAVAR
jgi:energy-coupling factor transport system ATP-binding protein